MSFARAKSFLRRPVEVAGREVPTWQLALAGTAVLFTAVYAIRRVLRPRYGFYTTADTVMENRDLTGQKIVVTGANTGLGKLTVQYLVGAGANVVMACRTEEKANKAIEDIVNSFPNDQQASVRKRLQFVPLDLNDFQSIYEFAQIYSSISDTLDQLINNAGIMALPEYQQTKQGFEKQFGVNHMGHSYLTILLTPFLKNSSYGGRVICLSSSAHRYTNLNKDFRTIIDSKMGPPKDGYNDFQNYGWSKTANMLFAYEYNKRHFQEYDIAAVSLHPGGIATDLGRHMNPVAMIVFSIVIAPFFFKSISQGIATTLRCATLTNNELKQYNGQYFADCNPSSVNKNPRINYIGSRFLKPDHNPNVNDQFATITSDFYDWTIKAIQETGFKLQV